MAGVVFGEMSDGGNKSTIGWMRAQRCCRSVVAILLAIFFAGGPFVFSSAAYPQTNDANACLCNSCDASCCVKSAGSPEPQVPVAPQPSGAFAQDLIASMGGLRVETVGSQTEFSIVPPKSFRPPYSGVPLYLRHLAQLI